MNIPTDLESLGRAFLAALVASLGPEGAAAVLMLLAVECYGGEQKRPIRRAEEGKPRAAPITRTAGEPRRGLRPPAPR